MSYFMARDLVFRFVLKPTLSLTKPALLQCRTGDSAAFKPAGHLASFVYKFTSPHFNIRVHL